MTICLNIDIPVINQMGQQLPSQIIPAGLDLSAEVAVPSYHDMQHNIPAI